MTIKEALNYSIDKLKQENVEEPFSKTKIVIANTLNVNKEYLIINENEILNNEQIDRIKSSIDKLIQGIPLQYITNLQEFMGLDFYVDENVLIPQPDTEILVEEAICILKNIEKPKILDLCTGSGAIAISIAKNINAKTITASDISNKALNVAKVNCKKNNVDNIKLIESDLFENITERFDIIVSNPPYIESNVIKTLTKEVQNEPKLALDGGKNGLDFYRRIINEASEFLEPNGYLCLEIGYNQKDKVINLMEKSKKYSNIYSKKDLGNNDRIVVCQKTR